jgi:hypothetical protein
MSGPDSRVYPKTKIAHLKRLSPKEIEEIQGLVKKGLSLRGVSRKTGVSYAAVYRYANQLSRRQSSIDFSVFSKRELGYIVGFFVGDGSRIFDKRNGHYGAQFGLDTERDSDITSLLSNLFKRSGKRVTLYSAGTWLIMRVYSKPLLTFLQGFVKYQEDNGETHKMLVDLHAWSIDFLIGFIGGLIDADGHVHKNKRRRGHFGADITTVNPVLVEQLIKIFNRLGLNPKVSKALPSSASYSSKPTYFVRLGKSDFNKICSELICVKHERCGCDAKCF